jgi:hypothetical protein
MAILITNDGDKVVNTIADRNAITKKFDGMQVTVRDAIADIMVGEGEALYQWSVDKDRWILIGKDKKDNLEFKSESKVLSGGKVTATEVPQSGLVWDCYVMDADGLILADINAPTITVKEINIGSTAYDGNTLYFSYGYGKIEATIATIMGDGGLLSVDTNSPSNMSGVVVADGTKLSAKTLTPSDISGFDAQAVTATASAISTAVSTAVTDLVNGAPGALDTLKEIADQLASDESAVSALTTTVATKAPLASPTFTGTVSGITKDMVGLGNVDNTTDLAKPISTATQSALDAKAELAGSATQDFVTKQLTVHSSILPNANSTLDIGSSTMRFKTIFVDEAKLSTNTLYIGDTAILGTSNQTVNIHADLNQSIHIQTTGLGATTLVSAKETTLTTTGANADVFLNATGAGSNVRIGATNELQVSAPTVFSAAISGTSQTLTGNLTVGGNLIVNGTQTTINSTTVTTKDNIIILNNGEAGSGVTLGTAGFRVDRGDLVDYELTFDEADDFFKLGAQGSTEIIATRPWATATFALVGHNHTVDSLSNVTISSKTSGDVMKWNGTAWVNSALSKSDVGLGNVDNTSDANKPVSTATSTALALKAPLASPTFTGTVGGITKAMVGLNNVDNTTDANKPVSTATQTALDLKAPLASPTFTGTVTGITKAMVGLANVDNTADADKPVSTATQTALDLKAPLASPTFTGTVSGITKAMVGLDSVDNTADADKPVSTAQQSALDLKAPLASPTFTGTVSGITKAMVGLANVDNTADLSKPISTATQTALNTKADQATTYTKTETDSRIQAVVGAAPAALDTLVEIAAQLASDESAASALATTVASKAPLASPTFTGTVSGITKAMVGLGNVDNTSDLNKPVSTAQAAAIAVETARAEAAEALKADKATTYTKTEVDAAIAAAIAAFAATLYV